jgi:hypothetical protein
MWCFDAMLLGINAISLLHCCGLSMSLLQFHVGGKGCLMVNRHTQQERRSTSSMSLAQNGQGRYARSLE